MLQTHFPNKSMKSSANKNFLAIFLLLAIFTSFSAPALAIDFNSLWSDDGQLIVKKCTGDGGECGWTDLIILANTVVRFLVFVSSLLAVMAFCYAGFLYITAFGEMGKVEQAHKIFSSAITGMFFVLCGWLIIATILKVLIPGGNASIEKIVPFSGVETIQKQ